MRLRRAGAALFAAVALAAPMLASAETPVDLELALGVDVSGSVDFEEARLQRGGYIKALTDPQVMAAIRSGFLGRIAALYFEWADEENQRATVGWTLLHDEASIRAFARAIDEAPAVRGRFTSISGAIDFAAPLFGKGGFRGTRRVIDLSGDGPNNVGRLVTEARNAAIARGIVINGLPIVSDRPDPFGMPMPNLDLYYQNCVIGGPGAFLVVAEDFRSFAVAIRRKLILEIAGLHPSPQPSHTNGIVPMDGVRLVQNRAPPCDEGERRLHQRFGGSF